MGIMKGSASLLTKTISGAFNSVSKITGSVSGGIAALSMDEEYMRDREKMKAKKPKHIVDGIGQGVVSVFEGIGKGITGVFLKPFEGAKKDGVKGFFKGTVMGITGLVTKPITGAIDLVSKTAEGMKNMVSFMDDKPTEQRERSPRVFYGYDKFYKEYFDLEAEMLTVLQLYKKGAHAKEDFFAAF
jgi:vacuolar protein sorting-associated protein 13A/C